MRVQPEVPSRWISRGVFRAETVGCQPPGKLRLRLSPGVLQEGLREGSPQGLSAVQCKGPSSLNKLPSQLERLPPDALQPGAGSVAKRLPGTPECSRGRGRLSPSE